VHIQTHVCVQTQVQQHAFALEAQSGEFQAKLAATNEELQQERFAADQAAQRFAEELRRVEDAASKDKAAALEELENGFREELGRKVMF
jgi:hypothetical protein